MLSVIFTVNPQLYVNHCLHILSVWTPRHPHPQCPSIVHVLYADCNRDRGNELYKKSAWFEQKYLWRKPRQTAHYCYMYCNYYFIIIFIIIIIIIIIIIYATVDR